VLDWDQSRLLLRWERRNQVGPGYAAELVRSGPGYQPGIGFVFRNDFTSLELRPRYAWLLGTRSAFRSVFIGAPAHAYWRNQDHSVESAEWSVQVGGELKTGENLQLSFRNSYESIRDGFDISGGASVVPGDYWFPQVEFGLEAARSASLRPTFQLGAGRFYDGNRIYFSARPAWNPTRYVELGLDYDYNRVRFPDRHEGLDLHVVRLRVQTALNVHLSLATLLQYDNADDAVGINARFRYNFQEGRDLWLVYNEALNTDRPLTVFPRLPGTQRRAFLLKYTHTLGF
jgi:hypothetical protein